MSKRRTAGLVAAGAIVTLVAAACGSSGGSSGGGGTSSSTTFNQAVTSNINPSSHKGGTIVYDNSSAPDSTDAGNTYYAFNLDFTRLYATPLTTYKSCAGSCGLTLVPGLATTLGVPTDNNKVWTYHLKSGVKFEDGQPVTSQDVKYAVERTFDRTVLPNGPSYFSSLLAGNAATYKGPFHTSNKFGLNSIDTPNASTVVFHLKEPFADFNYVVAFPQSAPVPPNKDTGTNYQLHPQSTGPYKFQSYSLNKQYVLVPNPEWNPSWDPQVKQLASKVIVNLNVNANDIDNRLLAGDIQMDQAGSGVQAAGRARILSSPTLKADSDDPVNGFMWFFYINTHVAPLNNIHCREAIEFAANKTNLQTAYGGPYGGDIASTAMPPTVHGYSKFDLYHALSQPNGDISAAKQQLQLCGHPSGFNLNIAYRSDRPREVSSAQALQAGLSNVGIKVTLKGYPAANYFGDFAGVPNYVHSHQLGVLAGGWGPDWPNAYGWGWALFDGQAIVPAGNANIAEENDPAVNKLFLELEAASSVAQQTTISKAIDLQVMKDAVLLPAVYSKALLYRNPNLTNVNVQSYYGMYNYGVLGTK
ncbi:MAG TPA: ABC transporter substrate-binding protein [Streptosporangiaceae bacterium]|jgi:peptide/nickel transport system substrate-binding protein|nr:ABC transporter substrate-binding protein [Streptosporangiaceae bacterium]